MITHVQKLLECAAMRLKQHVLEKVSQTGVMKYSTDPPAHQRQPAMAKESNGAGRFPNNLGVLTNRI